MLSEIVPAQDLENKVGVGTSQALPRSEILTEDPHMRSVGLGVHSNLSASLLQTTGRHPPVCLRPRNSSRRRSRISCNSARA